MIGVLRVLNFAPAIGETHVAQLFERLGGLAELTVNSRTVEVICLLAAIAFVRNRRHSRVTQTAYNHTETYLDSKYHISGGNVGAVGDHAHATNFNQLWNESKADIDLSALAVELGNLRKQIADRAEQPDHFAALSKLAAAEIAAKDGNGPLVFEKLKLAGAWFWDTAQKIGIGVATAAVKQALGF